MIAIGSDHGGYTMKQRILRHLEERQIPCEDMGCYSTDSCDYPEFGRAVAEAVAEGRCESGIVICTTGIGISMTANKVPGIRCALCSEPLSAKLTRLHNERIWHWRSWMYSWTPLFQVRRATSEEWA